MTFAKLCYDRGWYASASRLYIDGFRLDPGLQSEMQYKFYRYNAACAAAMTGCGQGKDEPAPDAAEKARWRKQSMAWLEDDLAAWARLVDAGSSEQRDLAVVTLTQWKADGDVAGLRDESELAKLPAAERAACRALWAGVDTLLKKAAAHP
jgi:hypothetical protein